MAADLELNDTRVEFLADYVLKTFKLKPDRWMKLYNIEDNKQMIFDWFEKGDIPHLLIIGGSGALTVQYEWPTQLKAKACYFIRKSKEGITKDTNLRNFLIFGDLSYSPVDQLSAFVDEVLVPVLTNDRNHDQWPQVVSDDVERHVHDLKGSVYVVSGQVKGRTLLPLPVGTEKSEPQEQAKGESYDRNLVHAIESVIIDWTHQIRDVLKRDSSQPLLEGLNPTPLVEVEFWKAKATNLECIYDQLRTPKVRKMAELLEKTNSSYFPSFKNIFRDVVAALSEAQDINMYLKSLKNFFDDMEQADFVDLKKMIPPMMHTICLVWSHSKYYNTPARIIVLLQEVCNMLINLASTYLDPTEVFKSEAEEAIDKVNETHDVMMFFKSQYEEHRDKLKDYFKDGKEPKEWEFAPQLVFARYDRFLERVATVKELFETALEFLKLEKIEFGGIKGKTLSAQVVQIFDEFNDLFKVFSERTYDCLDPTNSEFVADYKNFKGRIYDLDRRLGSIICQGFDDCSGLEANFKLVDIFGTLLDRPVITEIFDPKYPTLIDLMIDELDAIKVIYDEQMERSAKDGSLSIHKNMAKVSGGLKWALELRQRLLVPMDGFTHVDHPAMHCCMETERAKKKKVPTATLR